MRKIKEPEELLNLTHSLFESNEDLYLVLIGGLAAQEIYGNREVRPTSDIDILASREDAEEFVRRMGESGYETFYNERLDKYSVFKHEEGIHIDVYPGKVGKYSLERKRVLDINGLRVLSPEDLIGVKLYAWLISEKGNKKHLIDIYTIIIGKYEINLDYFLKEIIPYVSKITGLSEKGIIERMYDEKVLDQFSSKEIRFIKEEYKRIVDYLNREKCINCITFEVNG
jgi:hypothetical protein